MKPRSASTSNPADDPLLSFKKEGSPPLTRRWFLTAGGAAIATASSSCAGGGPKCVLLTFDDAVKSHRTFVAPLLKDLRLQATFFVTHRWMDDTENFMSWQDIAEIHEMGFEIGNHSWTHSDFSMPRNAGRMEGELALVENALEKAGVPRPVSFAWCGNDFGPEAIERLRHAGYRFARRGKDPEGRRRTLEIGAAYDPEPARPVADPVHGRLHRGMGP